jgi:hypothetical protein
LQGALFPELLAVVGTFLELLTEVLPPFIFLTILLFRSAYCSIFVLAYAGLIAAAMRFIAFVVGCASARHKTVVLHQPISIGRIRDVQWSGENSDKS